MLSCCKGSLLNAEEAAPGGGEWSVDKRENNTFCWVSIPMGFSTDIYIYIFWPLTKLTMSCSTLQHHFPARKCLQFLQGLHGHELERGCLLPESSWHQVRQPPGGVGPILTGWGLTLAMLAMLIIDWWLYNLVQISIGFCIGSPGSPKILSLFRPRLSCCDLWAQWSRVLNRKRWAQRACLRCTGCSPAGVHELRLVLIFPAFRRKMHVKFPRNSAPLCQMSFIIIIIIVNYH